MPIDQQSGGVPDRYTPPSDQQAALTLAKEYRRRRMEAMKKRRRRRLIGLVAAAASLCLLVVTGVALLIIRPGGPPKEPDIPDWIEPHLLDLDGHARTGEPLKKVRDLAIHYVGNPNTAAINNRNYPVVQSTVLVIATIFIVINLIVDILYCVIDPRISYE